MNEALPSLPDFNGMFQRLLEAASALWWGGVWVGSVTTAITLISLYLVFLAPKPPEKT